MLLKYLIRYIAPIIFLLDSAALETLKAKIMLIGFLLNYNFQITQELPNTRKSLHISSRNMKNVYGLLKCKRISVHFWERFPNYGIYVVVNFIYIIYVRGSKKDVSKPSALEVPGSVF